MPSKREREDVARGQSMRHIAAALPHADVYAMLTALDTYAATLEAIDRAFPDPLKRAMVSDARRLAQVMRDVNMARDFMPLGTVPALTVDERKYLLALLDATVNAVGADIEAKLQGTDDNTKAVR